MYVDQSFCIQSQVLPQSLQSQILFLILQLFFFRVTVTEHIQLIMSHLGLFSYTIGIFPKVSFPKEVNIHCKYCDVEYTPKREVICYELHLVCWLYLFGSGGSCHSWPPQVTATRKPLQIKKQNMSLCLI